MGVFKKGGRWYTDLYDNNGNRLRKVVKVEGKDPSTITRKDACDVEVIRKANKAKGIELASNKKDIFIETLIDRFLKWSSENRKSHLTDRSICKTLREYFKGRKVNSINLWDIEQFKSYRKKQGRSPETVNKDLGCLRRMMNLGVEWGLISMNPIQGMKLVKVPVRKYRVYKDWEFQKLHEAAPKHFKPILLFAYLTGCRNSEITRLKWDDIDFELNEITIRESKNNEYRTIPVHPYLKEVLLNLNQNPHCVYVFTTPKGKPYTGNTPWKRAWESTITKAEIEPGRFYDLRHTFISNLIVDHKEDFATVMALSGHKDIKMLKRYSHTWDEAKKKAIDKIKINLNCGLNNLEGSKNIGVIN